MTCVMPRDVDAARGDVGRDERVDAAGLEARERLLALGLRLVAVHRDGVHVLRAELLDEPVGAALGAHEDEREPALRVAQLVHERGDLGLVRDAVEAVVDVADLLRARACARAGAASVV